MFVHKYEFTTVRIELGTANYAFSWENWTKTAISNNK